jgi:PIN domain nuclease of toxin-antitoxin system
MESLIYLDTHVCAWLYAGLTERLTARGADLVESRSVLISPVVRLELRLLEEIGRLDVGPGTVIDSLARNVGLRVCDLPFDRVVDRAVRQDWTRDPFDRLIVSQAAVREATLLTRDRQITAHYSKAVW